RDGFAALRWLVAQQTKADDGGDAYLSVIGNDGWLVRGRTAALFDQQPLEAYALVDACLDAARLARHDDVVDARESWERLAWMSFAWFTGRNDLGLSLHDPVTGGCRDDLHRDGVNRNQGAESTLAYLLSVLELRRYDDEVGGAMSARVAE
ncbi:MAG: glycosyl transferase family 1, partial [Planctomycetota bacterium]